ncbi:hypothetical protein [Pelovirga terrestris]|uniref:Uncharacterized protein n=1 Tax=Pelovirga terrestris TaxID=2771352 RepID=A0A8J6QWS4_9BACT|nr:hypothetical protein [Pelovirga terrestris]MBD1399402.1 hypothetical protein [Pelovirga terrestris]
MQKDHLEVILENMDKKLDIIIEGYNALDRKIDSVRDELKQDISLLDFKIDTVNNHLSKKIDAVTADLKITDAKVDGVAADLKAHRADTEAHGNIYRVKES